MTSNTFNIQGGIQGGAISLGGDAKNFGTVSSHYNPLTIEAIQSELSKAERELHNAGVDAEVKKEALVHVQAARAEPTPDKLSKAVTFLKKVGSVILKTPETIDKLAPIATAITDIMGQS